MLSRILHCLRIRKKNAPQARQIFATLNQLVQEKRALRQDLLEAVETIAALQAQLAEYDLLVAHAEYQAPNPAAPALEEEEQTPGRHESHNDLKKDSGETGIGDIWLSSSKHPVALLEAETQWKEGYPELAMDIVSRTICTDPFLSPVEELRCRVFVAAVLHCLGRYEESSKRLEVVLQMISRHYLFDFSQSNEITGIAHFIQGRNLMALKEFPAAYWSFSHAQCTPGYHVQAWRLQKQAIKDFTRQESTNDIASLTTSLCPLLSCTESQSSSWLDLPAHPSTTSLADGLDKSIEPGFNIREPAVSGGNDRNIASRMFCKGSVMLLPEGEGRWF